jgi:hypothetical protein
MKSVIGKEHQNYRTAGVILIGAGLLFVVDQVLQTGWLSLLVMPVLGIVGVYTGIHFQKHSLMIPGSLILGLGTGGFFILNRVMDVPFLLRLGLLLASMGAGFLVIFLSSRFMSNGLSCWALVPGLILVGTGIPFIINRITIFEFVLYVVSGTGLSLIIWGTIEHLIGLIIPGCLLIGIGPGVYFPWSKTGSVNGLTETGVMLVWFALGWGLITIASRLISQRFIWWPLIPGGLLAVVGWGLYIGGDPGNALAFIGNTGSIGLIIFGVYLLLIRRGFKD